MLSSAHITEAELKFLEDALEEESLSDRDYYFSSGTVDLLLGQWRGHRPPIGDPARSDRFVRRCGAAMAGEVVVLANKRLHLSGAVSFMEAVQLQPRTHVARR